MVGCVREEGYFENMLDLFHRLQCCVELFNSKGCGFNGGDFPLSLFLAGRRLNAPEAVERSVPPRRREVKAIPVAYKVHIKFSANIN